MPLFDSPVSPHLLWPINAHWPKRRARQLLTRFQKSFPEIVYDMDLGTDVANAQAFLDGGKKRVRLYGGLVRHRKIGTPGLAFALAHETGHHLGGPPFLQYYQWLSSEERATEWGIGVGLVEVFGLHETQRMATRGLHQLKQLDWPS